jgi:hypothetical protein
MRDLFGRLIEERLGVRREPSWLARRRGTLGHDSDGHALEVTEP